MNNTFLFNEKKAAQAASYFLFKAHGRLSVLKLMKLLYLAERRSFELFHSPIIGDSLVSMPHGPVLSLTLNKINGTSRNSVWDEWIADREDQDLALRDASRIRNEDDLLALSENDLVALSNIWESFGHWDKFALRDYTHTLPEWHDPCGSSKTIQYKSLFSALGFSKTESSELIHHLETQIQINQTFTQACEPL